MFHRVRETVSNRYANAQTTRRKRITRRRIKASAQPSEDVEQLANDEGDYDDNASVRSTITVETTRTASNENRKQLADPNHRPPTQVFVERNQPGGDPSQDPLEVLERAQSDITKLSVYLQGVSIGRSVASACLALIRGDNRSWEAIAVDILRQKARWDNVTIEDCEGEYMDTLLGCLLNLDNTVFLHLSNLILTPNAAWTFQSLAFSRSMTKLQLDLIDLSFAMPLLCKGLHANNSLECLITSRCGLNDDRLAELFTSLPKRLQELRIFGNKCRDKGLAAITAVVHHSQDLKILDLSYQHVDARDTNDSFDVTWLMGALHHNRTLKVLDLDNDGIDDGHLTHLCASLCVNDTLEEVMLNHNRITATGIALLSSKFGEMKGLKKISMYSNLFDAPQVDSMVSSSAQAAAAAAASQNQTPTPRTVEVPQDDEPSDLEDELDDDGIDYDEETVAEEEELTEKDNGDDDDEDGDGDYDDDDDSSAPPPSADFREPVEMEQDSMRDDDEEDDIDAQVEESESHVPADESETDGAAVDETEHDESATKVDLENGTTNGAPAPENEHQEPFKGTGGSSTTKDEEPDEGSEEAGDELNDEDDAEDDEDDDDGDDGAGLAEDEEEDSVLGIIVN